MEPAIFQTLLVDLHFVFSDNPLNDFVVGDVGSEFNRLDFIFGVFRLVSFDVVYVVFGWSVLFIFIEEFLSSFGELYLHVIFFLRRQIFKIFQLFPPFWNHFSKLVQELLLCVFFDFFYVVFDLFEQPQLKLDLDFEFVDFILDNVVGEEFVDVVDVSAFQLEIFVHVLEGQYLLPEVIDQK